MPRSERRECRRGLDLERRPYDHQQVTCLHHFQRFLPTAFWKNLSKPDHVGSKVAATVTTSRRFDALAETRPLKLRQRQWTALSSASKAPQAVELPMEMDDVRSAGALMEIIDILRDDPRTWLMPLKGGQSLMPPVWQRSPNSRSPGAVPGIDQRLVGTPSLG